MACTSKIKAPSLRTLIEECPDYELTMNLNILKSDLESHDMNVSWLSALAEQLETYDSNTSTLNIYEQIRMFVELRKLIPKMFKLHTELSETIESTEKLCPDHNLNFDLNLTHNIATHRSLCKSCNITDVTNEDLTELELYPSHVVNFVRACDKCDVNTVRVHSTGRIECLLCYCEIPLSHMAKIREHFSSEGHLSNVHEAYKYLASFHKFWSIQKPEIRNKELQFKFEGSRVRCVVCEKSTPLCKVEAHLFRCSMHVSPRGKYPLQTENYIFKEVPFIQLSDDFYPMFQLRHCETHCLMCNTGVLGDQQAHIESPQHVAQQDSEAVLRSLKCYHDFWIDMPVDKHKWMHFFTRGDDTLTCTACKISIDYDQAGVADHVRSAEHSENIKKGWKHNIKNYASKYSAVVLCNLFKNSPMVDVNNRYYPVFQQCRNTTFCMICNVRVLTECEQHLSSVPHILRQGETDVRESLARYHDVWMKMPLSLQYKQIHFRRDTEKMVCTKCNVFMDYNAHGVKNHLVRSHGGGKSRSERRKNRNKNKVEIVTEDDTTSRDRLTSPISDSSSVVAMEIAESAAVPLLVISDEEEPAIKEEYYDEPPTKTIKVEDDSEMTTVAPIEEVFVPSYSYQDYKANDFIPLSVDNSPPDRMILRSRTIKSEPSCSNANGFD